MKLTPFPATLKNGTPVLVREVTQEDRHLLQIGFEHLSGRARYFRFLGAHQNLTEEELDKFTATNGPDHVAVGALLIGGPAPEPIGIARYIRLPDQHDVAEIAITIADQYQHQGLGSLFLGLLAKFAQLDGITEFNALVHSKNTAMLGLLTQFGGTQTEPGGEDVEVRIPVSIISAQGPKSSTGNALGDISMFADVDQTDRLRSEGFNLSGRSANHAPASESVSTCEALGGVARKVIKQTSAKLRQIVNVHQDGSEFMSPDQPTSVWENEGGAIVPTVHRTSVDA